MRNLKRALSLALASVMLLGMMVVGSSAAGYADVASEHNAEAIEVLQAVGVMTGDQNGNFNPDATLTRNEMAVVMCNLMDYVVSSYHGAVTFSDVPAWAADYVSACATNGIVSGIGDGKYGGDMPVTTGQAGLMLMKALGYFQYGGDFGQDWLVATTKKGNEIGLFDDVDNGATAALTRNQAAQMVLNALQADMVSPDGNGNITISPDGTITSNATYDARTSTNSKYGKIDDERSVNNGRYLVQLGEDLFNGDLKKITTRTDDFGRPCTKWEYKDSDVGTYADGNDNSIVLNKDMSADKAIYSDSDYLDYATDDVSSSVVIYVNGKEEANTRSGLSGVNLKAGDYVEVFENSNNDVATIAVTRYSLAVIDEIDDNLSSTHTKKGASCSITLEDLGEGGFGSTYYDAYENDSDKVLPGFIASTYTEGTVLAIAMADNGTTVLASHIATSVEGPITAVNSGSKAKITVDGTQYPVHGEFDLSGNTTATRTNLDTLNLRDSDYAVYLDTNGYVIGIDEVESAKISDVYYVTGILRDQSRYTSYYAQAVSLEDGTVTEFQLKERDENTNKAFKNDDSYTIPSSPAAASYIETDGNYTSNFFSVQGLFTFDKDGSKYTAKRYVTKTASNKDWQAFDSTYEVVANGVDPDDLTDDLARDDTRMKLANNPRFYLNSSTNYLKVEDEGNNLDVKFITGGTSVKWDTNGDTTADVSAIAVTKKDSKNDLAVYVILVSDDFKNATSDDVVFVHEQSSDRVSYTDADGKKQTGYDTELYFLDGSGKIETVTVTGSAKAAGYYTWEINDDDVYELTAVNSTTLDKALSLSDDYDDETGSVGFVKGTGANAGGFDSSAGVTLDRIYNDALTAEDIISTYDAVDVDFANTPIIRDDRGEATRSNSVYTSQIQSISALKTAIERSNDKSDPVKAIVYFDDGKVVMVYVLSTAAASGGGGGGANPGTSTTGDKVNNATNESTVKSLPDGMYQLNDTIMSDKTAGSVWNAVGGIHGTAAENKIFKFETTKANQSVWFYIYDKDGNAMYYETGTYAATGGHFFLVQVLGTCVNQGEGPMKTTGLDKGTYTWEVTSGNDILASGGFTVK